MLKQFFIFLLLFALIGGAVLFHKDILQASTEFVATQEAQQLEAAGQWTAAIAKYQQALKAHPGNPGVMLRLAGLRSKLGGDENLAAAEKLYKQLLDTLPANDSKRLTVLLGLGRTQQQQPEHLNHAVASYREALETFPANPEVLKALGEVYKRAATSLTQHDSAALKTWLYRWSIYYSRQASRVVPRDFAARFNTGVAYQELQEPEHAATEFCNAIMLAPQNAEAHFNLGVSLVSLKAYDLGYQEMAKAVQLLTEQNKLNQAHALAQQAQDVKNVVFRQQEAGLSDAEGSAPGFLTHCIDVKK